jgi:hypothetical protein
MKLIQMDVSQAISFLGLNVVKSNGNARFLNSDWVEVTTADADQSIRESQENLALAEQSPLAGGAQYAHIRNISAWTTIRSLLKVEES